MNENIQANQSVHYLEVLQDAAETRQRLGDGQGQEEDGQQSWGPEYRHPGIAESDNIAMGCSFESLMILFSVRQRH